MDHETTGTPELPGFRIEDGVLTGYAGAGGHVAIPEGVTRIGDRAFRGCTGLTGVTVPESVTRIGDFAFRGCRGLRSVAIAASSTRLGQGVFDDCPALRCFHVPTPDMLPVRFQPYALIGFAGEPDADPASERGKAHTVCIIRQLANPDFIRFVLSTPSLLSFVCRQKLINAARFDLYWQAAEESRDPAVLAVLLDYRQHGIGAGKLDAARNALQKQQERQEDRLLERALRQQNGTGVEGLVFVLSGRLATFRDHREARACIEALGGKLAPCVQPQVDYLVTDDPYTASPEKRRAAALGIEVISEAELNRLLCRIFKDQAEIAIPPWVAEISSDAFRNCRHVCRITVPAGVRCIREGAFDPCKSLTGIDVDAGNERFASVDGVLYDKGMSKLLRYPAGREALSFTIPEGVTCVEARAFLGCTALRRLVIPACVTTIGADAFTGCQVHAWRTDPCLTLMVTPGSPAEQYCRDNGFRFAYG